MNNLAVITARGGSKRIHKKNIRYFNGKPIIAYSIEAALNSGVFNEIMVSTDSLEIADIARKHGAKVPFMRSEKTSSDYATTTEVLNEVLSEYSSRGMEFNYMCCIYPTAPFITTKILKDAYELILENGAVEVLPVVRFSFPPQRAFIVEQKKLKYKYPQYMNSRSQDLETIYHDAGQFYMYDVKKYLELGGIITEGMIPIVLSDLEVQDIDTEIDWKLAELKYKLLDNKKR